jgi:predicted nucleic acid-binding Zn ribbon protein
MDRSQLKAGYSPFVWFSRSRWDAEGRFSGSEIRWRETIGSAIAHEDGEKLPIRVPGLLLRDGCPVPTRPLRPAEYSKVWAENDIDGYLQAWADLNGEKRCLNCHGPISPPVNDRKRFCGEKCRNAAKQRRFRERNPEAAERAQSRYWRSLGDLGTEGEPS